MSTHHLQTYFVIGTTLTDKNTTIKPEIGKTMFLNDGMESWTSGLPAEKFKTKEQAEETIRQIKDNDRWTNIYNWKVYRVHTVVSIEEVSNE